MKTCLTFLIGFLIASMAKAQTVYIANSNNGATPGPNVFTGAAALSDAVAAAAAGDIIYLIPSGSVYNGVAINKALTVIGPGFNPSGASSATAVTSTLSITANNVRVSGITTAVSHTISVSGANVMIDRCRATSVNFNSGASNIVIQNCVLGSNGSPAISGSSAASNARISNNILQGILISNTVNGINGGTIEHNLFTGTEAGGTVPAFSNVQNCNIRNNIFYAIRPFGTSAYSDNIVSNNISFGSSDNNFPTTNGNSSVSNHVGEDPQFVNYTFNSNYQYSYDISLQPASPGKNAATDGTDIGVFGSLTPFDVHGTILPVIQDITAPPVISTGSDMTIRIQARGN